MKLSAKMTELSWSTPEVSALCSSNEVKAALLATCDQLDKMFAPSPGMLALMHDNDYQLQIEKMAARTMAMVGACAARSFLLFFV
jgi:sulfur transfer complex TusBCD TusB component (DsrH family)